MRAFRQVQRRLPQSQHGGETARTDAAGLQAAAVQSGEIRREGENGSCHSQTAPGKGVRGHMLSHVARVVNRAAGEWRDTQTLTGSERK